MRTFINVLFSLLFGTVLQAQQAFHLELGSYSESRVISAPHPSGGFVVATSTEAFTGNNFKKLHLLHVNDSNDIVWSKYLQVDGDIAPIDVEITDSGDILVVSNFINFSAGSDRQIAVLCFDKDGKEKWKKNISGGFSDITYSLHISSQNEIILYGITHLTQNTDSRIFLLKMDLSGTIIESKTFIRSGLWGVSTLTSDDHIIIQDREFIWKVKPDSTIVWSKEKLFSIRHAYAITEDKDGNYIFLFVDQQRWFLAKIRNYDGELMWKSDGIKPKNPMAYPGLFLYDIALADDGGYIAAGKMLEGDFAPTTIAVAAKFDAAGKYLKTIMYKDSSGYSQSVFYKIHQKGNAVFFIGNTGEQGEKMLMVKTGTGLNTYCSSVADIITQDVDFGLINASIPVNNRTFTNENLLGMYVDLPVVIKKTCEACDTPTVVIAADTILCPTDTIELKTTGTTGNYLWSTGDTTASIKVHKEGTYWVTVSNVCGEATDSIIITEGTAPQPNFTISPTETEPDKFVNFSDNSQNVQQRLWHTGDGFTTDTAKFSHSYTQNGIYPAKLELTGPDGCTWDTTVFINISYYSWFLPNAFTPNNNDLNEVFEVKGYGILEYRLQVYNRWGEQIYDGTNQGWDGRYKGERVQPGMYVYTLFLQFDDYRVVNHSGEVYVVE